MAKERNNGNSKSDPTTLPEHNVAKGWVRKFNGNGLVKGLYDIDYFITL
jgi:hypothetical protein